MKKEASDRQISTARSREEKTQDVKACITRVAKFHHFFDFSASDGNVMLGVLTTRSGWRRSSTKIVSNLVALQPEMRDVRRAGPKSV